MDNTNVQLFSNPQFGNVRIVKIEGKPYFVANDVASALGYSSPKDAISRHCKGATFYRLSDNQGIMRDTKVIPQGDIYRLATKSELPGAEEFESWIFDEVLVSIANHGAYMTPQTIDDIISDPANGIKLLQALQTEREEKEKLEIENRIKDRIIEESAPKIEWHDKNQDSVGLHTVTACAEGLLISSGYLNKVLLQYKIVRKTGGEYSFTSRYQGKGYGKQVPKEAGSTHEGVARTQLQLKFYEKGRRLIFDVFEHAKIDGFIVRRKDGRWILSKNYGYTEFGQTKLSNNNSHITDKQN